MKIININKECQHPTVAMYYCRKSANFELFSMLVKVVSADRTRFTKSATNT